MIISNVEIKTAANNNTYKQVSFAEKAYGKDRTNVFSNHPMYPQLVVGFDIPLSSLEVNTKGYLELKGAPQKRSVPQNAPQNDETLMRLEKYITNINSRVNAIYKHLGIEEVQYAGNTSVPYVTPEQEGIDITRSGMVDDIKPEDIPF